MDWAARANVATRIGVLALQGSVAPHREMLAALGERSREVRLPADLTQLTHLIVPGGESTTLEKLLTFYELWEPIEARARAGDLALFGTCAGAILLSQSTGESPRRWQLMGIETTRNAYGRQVDSFTNPLEAPQFGALEGVFIRAPQITRCDPAVEILAECAGRPVLVRQDRLLAATFHPELTSTTAVHEYFLRL